jgi:hypothetical protein
MLPHAPRPGRHPGLDQRPCRPAGAKAAPPPRRRPRGGPGPGSTLVRASHGQRRPLPSRPARGRQATTPPADHGARRPVGPNRGRPATPSHSRSARRGQRGGSAADTGACPSGHLDAADAWTPDAWTLDAWTLDVRSTGWTDIPTAGPGARTGQRPAWPASGHPRAGDHPLGGPTAPRSRRLGALGHPGRLRGDGTCAAGPDRRRHWTAAQHRPASGRAPAHCCPQKNGMSVGRDSGRHPVYGGGMKVPGLIGTAQHIGTGVHVVWQVAADAGPSSCWVGPF